MACAVGDSAAGWGNTSVSWLLSGCVRCCAPCASCGDGVRASDEMPKLDQSSPQPPTHQPLHQRRIVAALPASHRVVQRRPAAVVDGVHVSARLHECHAHRGRTRGAGAVQRRAAVRVLGVHLRAGLQQQAQLRVARRGGSVSELRRGCCVRPSTRLFRPAVCSGPMERGASRTVPGCNVSVVCQ